VTRNVRRTLLTVVVLVFGAASGAGAWLWYTNQDQTPPSALTLYGNVEIREVELAFDAQGRIDGIEVEEGDRVEKRQLLAALDDERFRHELDRAQAQEEAQRQVVAELEAGTRPEEIRAAEADLEAAEARQFEARTTRDRIVPLVPTGAASEQQLDDATAAYEVAQADRGRARAALDLAQAGPRQQEIKAAQARLKQREAETALAQWQLEQASLFSPVPGVIRQRILEPGDMVARGQPVFTLALLDPVWVRAYVGEPDLGKIRPGMTAQVTTDSFPDKAYEGWIGFISPTAEFTPKTVQTEELRTRLVYEIRVYVRNPQDQLRLGMPATVSIPLDRSTDAASEASSDAASPDAEPDESSP
jgi:HlyD family secretion protein